MRGGVWFQNPLHSISPLAEASGANFGWTAYEGFATFRGGIPRSATILPALAYPHQPGCAVTGGYVVRDRRLARIRGREIVGDYMFADYCTGRLYGFRPRLGRRPGKQRSFRFGIRYLSSLGEDNLGRIYVKQTKWAEAMREFEQAVRLAPDDKSAHKMLHELRARKSREQHGREMRARRPGRREVRSVGEDQENTLRRQLLEHLPEELERGGIHPMEIFDQQDRRLLATEAQQPLDQQRQRLLAQAFGAERRLVDRDPLRQLILGDGHGCRQLARVSIPHLGVFSIGISGRCATDQVSAVAADVLVAQAGRTVDRLSRDGIL